MTLWALWALRASWAQSEHPVSPKWSVGDLLGYYTGHDDPLSAFLYPKKISWDTVRSRTQVEVAVALPVHMLNSTWVHLASQGPKQGSPQRENRV